MNSKKINPTKLCFFDDYWLDFRVGTVRRWYEPSLLGTFYDPAFDFSAEANVIYDENSRKYRVIYPAMVDSGQDELRLCCMVETEDFKTFTPVPLRKDGPEDRRHVVRDCEDRVSMSTITFDRAEPDPQKRYKCTARLVPDKIVDPGNIKLIGGTSPDAVQWKFDLEHLLHSTNSDADNTILYNPVTEEYMLFLRAGFVDRRICCKTSKDLIHWSDAVVTAHPGAPYNNEAHQIQFYGMVPTYSDGIFYAMMQIFTTSLTDMDFSKMWGFVDTELYYSYDGYHYMPTSGRPVVARPAAPELGCTQLYLMHLCDSADGRNYILSGSGFRVIHGTNAANKSFSEQFKGQAFGCSFYQIRKDGFCGIEGAGIGAKIITKGVQLLDDEITINVNSSCGYVRYGLMKDDGTFIDGFSFDDCFVLEFRDEVSYPLTWKEHSISEVLGQQVRIAVELNGATLHSMTITGRPYIRQPQRSFADPEGLLE